MGLTQDLVNWYSISNVEIYFGDDGTKSYLIFQFLNILHYLVEVIEF